LRQRHVFACQAYPARTAAGRRWFARTRLPCSPNMPPLYDFKHPRSPTHERGGANLIDIPDPKEWWSLSGSNRRPEACKATALPAELRPLGEAKGLTLASSAGGSVRSLGCPAHQHGRPFGLATLSRRSCATSSGSSDPARPTGRRRRFGGKPKGRRSLPASEATNNGGPGTTRTSDLTLIRGAL
jgi:hypothetical protein